MRCPICKQIVSWEGNPFRPFCCERCKLIDFDNWLEERYRVSARLDTGKEDLVGKGNADSKGERD